MGAVSKTGDCQFHRGSVPCLLPVLAGSRGLFPPPGLNFFFLFLFFSLLFLSSCAARREIQLENPARASFMCSFTPTWPLSGGFRGELA